MTDSLPLSLGIDLGGTSVKFALCRGPQVERELDRLPTADFAGPEALLDGIVEQISDICPETEPVDTLGVGVPGFVDHEQGIVHTLTNVPGWQSVPLREILEKRTGRQVAIANDANLMAYGEWKHGAGQGVADLMGVTLGTGVGAGLILGGKLFAGANGGAGELGQTSVDFHGKAGTYGNTGAVEEYIGNREFTAYAQQLYRAAGQQRTLEECEPKHLAAAARAGEALALHAWDYYAEHLACCLAHACWLLNLPKIVIGGGVAAAGKVLFTPLRKRLKAQLAEPFRENLEIVPAALGNQAGVIGAAALALDQATG
ncbi:MAG: ROK family protein [Verrucomicrobiota bacterium]